MFLKDNNKVLCNGCTACLNICPKKAIYMYEDEEGFKYPKIDKEKCINCGACYKICPNIKKSSENNLIEAYGVKHKNIEERLTSRSGAIFIAISDYILKQNGIIYGVKQYGKNEGFYVAHKRATTKEERDEFKGSKYVQSDMKNVIEQIKLDLKEGKKVLFSGTPCQVAGVKACVPEIHQENLYTCDLVCHGVPSPMVYKDVLKYLEKTENKKIEQFNFRNKKFGWDCHFETTTFEDGSEISTQYFRNLFYGHNILRPACHKCNFANTHRPADITIADFWGVDEIAPEFCDDIGISLTILNSNKGKELFEAVKEDLEIINCSLEDCIKYTYTLNQPTPISEDREQFWKDYEEKEFDYIIDKYAKNT